VAEGASFPKIKLASDFRLLSCAASWCAQVLDYIFSSRGSCVRFLVKRIQALFPSRLLLFSKWLKMLFSVFWRWSAYLSFLPTDMSHLPMYWEVWWNNRHVTSFDVLGGKMEHELFLRWKDVML
jgi:hypothetical protein